MRALLVCLLIVVTTVACLPKRSAPPAPVEAGPTAVASGPRCPTCLAAGVPHRVYEAGYCTMTLLAALPAYWDEQGRFHQPPDPNTTTCHYVCNHGHSWAIKS